jgi:hypothetical protein
MHYKTHDRKTRKNRLKGGNPSWLLPATLVGLNVYSPSKKNRRYRRSRKYGKSRKRSKKR